MTGVLKLMSKFYNIGYLLLRIKLEDTVSQKFWIGKILYDFFFFKYLLLTKAAFIWLKQ